MKNDFPDNPIRLSVLFALLVSLVPALALAEELRMYAAAGVKAPLMEMAAEFEKDHGQKIALVFDTAGRAEQLFLADSGAVLLITTDKRIGDAEKDGKLKGGLSSPLADTVGGFAVPPGSPKPDLSTPEKLKTALIAAPHIVFSDPARGATVGMHFMKVIEALGIKEEVLKKSTLAKDGVETMRMILTGKADLGVTQLAEVVQANRASLVGPFPGEFDLATTYSLWYRTDAAPAVKTFVLIATGPVGRSKLEKHGLRPSSR
jgi:molybdate transport system substrate-binding protein